MSREDDLNAAIVRHYASLGTLPPGTPPPTWDGYWAHRRFIEEHYPPGWHLRQPLPPTVAAPDPVQLTLPIPSFARKSSPE